MSKFLRLNSQNGIIKKDYTSLINTSLKISHRILFQCCAVSISFLAIGCNTGNIYVFNIQNSKFKYWSNIITNDASIIGMQFAPSKNYLAYHNKKYQIIIYKLNLVNEKNLMIRQIDGSQNSPVHSLVWEEDCSKLYCSYSNGTIDIIFVPQNTKDYFHVPSEGLLKLDRQEIVQLELMKDLLLISTNERVVLMNVQTKYMTFIGTKPRSGQYGACFWFDSLKQLKIVSARPGFRLWIALVDGTVEETQQYKTWNNSLKFKLNEADTSIAGSGQYVSLAMVRNSNLLVAVENDGLLFLIDLIKKSCLAVIDYGVNLSKILCSSDRMIFNSQKEVVCLSIGAFKDALLTILDEDIEATYAIDLFLEVMHASEDIDTNEYQAEVRQISHTLSPDLLSRLVQKSAEINYRFPETNKVQVFIQDNEEYQNIFSSSRLSDTSLSKASGSIADFPDDGSTESDCSNDTNKRNKKNIKRMEKRKGFIKTPQLLQTIYDKTSSFLTNIDVLSSSNSDAHLNLADSYSDTTYQLEHQDMEPISLQEIANNIPESMVTAINLMELEANGYIASEKYKQRDVDEDSRVDFLESLSNFCETWLSLNLEHWKKLIDFELYIRNLSATFLIFHSKASISSNDENFQSIGGDNFIQEQMNAQFANSWSTTISTSDWMKSLPIADKIYHMTSNLLSHCFFTETYGQFPGLIRDINELTRKYGQFLETDCVAESCRVNCYVNEYSAGVSDKETQIDDHLVDAQRFESTNRYADLMKILEREIWSEKYDGNAWIGSVIQHFHGFLNIKSIRQWLRSGISHKVWSLTLDNYRDVCSLVGRRDQDLSERSHADLEKILLDSLCADTVYSFVVVDEIISIMKAVNIINWRMLIESENLDCRDVLHLAFEYDLDLTDYVVYLFKYVSLSIRFSTRHSLLEHIYSQSDVVVSFMYSLLLNISPGNDDSPLRHDCGLLIRFSTNVLPANVNSLAIEILKWGADQGVVSNKNPKLFSILMKLCLDAGYHEGYIEILIGDAAVKSIVQIGVQVGNLRVLERVKECPLASLTQLLDVIDLIIDCRRRQTKEPPSICCLACGEAIEYGASPKEPLTWTEIATLIFTKLADDYNYMDILHNVLPKLSDQEMEEMKPLLVGSIDSLLGKRKVVERNHMMKFMRSEMSPEEASGDITEKYLNIYTMSRHELSGPNWGRIITNNLVCDLCGIKLLTKVDGVAPPREIVAFCCNHTFHRQCFLEFGLSDDCLLC